MSASIAEAAARPKSQASGLSPEMVLAAALVQAGAIDQEKLRRALRVQKKLSPPKRLVPVLENLGYTTEEKVLEVIREAKPRIHLGNLLVELGRLSEHDLRTALSL